MLQKLLPVLPLQAATLFQIRSGTEGNGLTGSAIKDYKGARISLLKCTPPSYHRGPQKAASHLGPQKAANPNHDQNPPLLLAAAAAAAAPGGHKRRQGGQHTAPHCMATTAAVMPSEACTTLLPPPIPASLPPSHARAAPRSCRLVGGGDCGLPLGCLVAVAHDD